MPYGTDLRAYRCVSAKRSIWRRLSDDSVTDFCGTFQTTIRFRCNRRTCPGLSCLRFIPSAPKPSSVKLPLSPHSPANDLSAALCSDNRRYFPGKNSSIRLQQRFLCKLPFHVLSFSPHFTCFRLTCPAQSVKEFEDRRL